MRRALISLGSAVVSIGLITSIAVAAPEGAGSGRAKNDDHEGTGMVAALNRQVDRMVSFSGLSADTVRALRTEQNLGWGVICMVNQLDQAIAAKDLNAIVADFKAGKGLGDIAKENGVEPSGLGNCGKAFAAAAKAKANAAAKGANASNNRGGPPAHAKDKASSPTDQTLTGTPAPGAKGGPPAHAKNRIPGATVDGTPTPGAGGGPPAHAKARIPEAAGAALNATPTP